MDGTKCPNITIGPPVLKSRRVARLVIDVHLMIENPDRYVEAFIEAGAASVTIHAEAVVHLHRVVHFIRAWAQGRGGAQSAGDGARIAGTSTSVAQSARGSAGGLSSRSESKVRAVRDCCARGSSAPIEVDGGIDAIPRRGSSRQARHPGG
jgi:ribulose-phosphate 3-epimerase